jgi:hypothetical protein
LKKVLVSLLLTSMMTCSLEDGKVWGSPAIKHRLWVISCKCVISVNNPSSCSCSKKNQTHLKIYIYR